jgi:Isocitrate/isopropylmalate dehydrogenase
MIRQLQGAAFHSTRKKRRVRGLKFQHTTKESTMDSGSQVHKIAAMPGDGIGKEVMPEGLRVLDAASRRFGFELKVDHINWGSCEHYMKTGAMMPPDWKEQLQGHDAIYFGAVGWPATVPDHVSLLGSLLKLRREFDQYINLRPVRLFDGVPPVRWPGARRATSTSSSCARTPRANTRISADASSKVPIARSSSRNRCSRATAPTGS